MKLRRVVAPTRDEHGIRLLEGVVAMLTKMICASTWRDVQVHVAVAVNEDVDDDVNVTTRAHRLWARGASRLALNRSIPMFAQSA